MTASAISCHCSLEAAFIIESPAAQMLSEDDQNLQQLLSVEQEDEDSDRSIAHGQVQVQYAVLHKAINFLIYFTTFVFPAFSSFRFPLLQKNCFLLSMAMSRSKQRLRKTAAMTQFLSRPRIQVCYVDNDLV